MFKEEQVLFPYVQRLEAAFQEGRSTPLPPFGTIANPIAMMMAERYNAGEVLNQIPCREAISSKRVRLANRCALRISSSENSDPITK